MIKASLKKIIVFLLTAEAKSVLKKYKPRIVAITGSVGKTSAKDAIYAALSADAFVRKSEKSFNSEIGVPLTILGRPNAWMNPLAWISNIFLGLLLVVFRQKYPEWLILEVGADRPGDIKNIAKWLVPDIVVVTRFADVPVHVEYFKSPDAVFAEKAELVKALREDGTLVLSKDDEKVAKLASLSPKAKLLTFGFSRGADIHGSKISVLYEGGGEHRHPAGMKYSIQHQDKTAVVKIQNTIGKQALFASLAGIAVGLSLGKDLEQLAGAIPLHESAPGRMKLVEGLKESLIIDDTYNSSPVAVREALDGIFTLKIKGRRFAVLGDMLELGRYSVSEHKSIGSYVAGKVDMLITVGVRSRDTVFGAIEAGMEASRIMQFDDSYQAGKALQALLHSGDVILIKGSQGIRMERAVEEIMAHPEEKEKLLVRQETEWRNR